MLAGVLVASLLAACGTKSGTTEVQDPVPTTLSITPGTVAFSFLGESRTLSGNVVDQNGDPFTASVTWSTDDASVVSITDAGLATAEANGTANITATAEGLTATLAITVLQVPRVLLIVQGDDQEAVAGNPLPDTIVVRVTDLGGAPVEGVDVDFEPDSTAGTVSEASVTTPADGYARTVWTLGSAYGPQSLGVSTTDLSVTLGSFSRSENPIADLLFSTSITVVRTDPTSQDSVVAQATVQNQGDLDSGGYRVQALVDGVEVGFVDQPALGPGDDAMVEVELGMLTSGFRNVSLVIDPADDIPELIETNNSGARSVNVLAQAPMSVGSPENGLSAGVGQELLFRLVVPPGSDDALTIQVTDASAGALDDLDLFVHEGDRPGFREDYSDCVSAGPSTEESCQIVFPEGTYHILLYAWQDDSGQFSPTGFSDVTLTATLGNTILPFDIDVVILDNGTASQDQAFLDAAARWTDIIAGDIPQQDFTSNSLPAGACFETQPVIDDVIDDVRIFVRIEPIDGVGGTLAQAGPCYLRAISDLPVFGAMIFDQDDLSNLESNNTMVPVVLHEMGHVLGIGTIWDDRGLLQAPSLPNNSGADTHFTGDGATEAFDAAGGTTYADSKVPVENELGEGSSDSHWRENVMDIELMTPLVENTGGMPLSAITILSLQDLGYGVDVNEADGYVLPLLPAVLAQPSAAETAGVVDLRGDIREGPITVIDSKGRVVEVRW